LLKTVVVSINPLAERRTAWLRNSIRLSLPAKLRMQCRPECISGTPHKVLKLLDMKTLRF